MARKWKLEELCIIRELPSTCVFVKVNKIIDTKTFCVSQLQCSEDLQKLEETLGKEFCPSLYKPPRYPFLPEEEEMVAVQDYTTGQCHRGVVKYGLQTARGYVYCVFLVDHGTCLQVTSSYIRILPKHLMQLKWQAYQIELYGILPTTVEMNYEEMKLERAVTVVWTDAAMSFVSETIQRSRYACFDRKMERRNRYGDLYLPQDGGFVNLGDVLVQMEFAIKDETAFIELVNRLENGLPDSPESCSGPSLIQTKQCLLEEHVEKCRQEQAMLSETRRRRIEKWREESKEALLNKEEDGFSSPSRKSYSAETETSMENNNKAVPKRDELLFPLEAYKKSESSPHIDNVSKEIELRSENELTHESKTVNTTALDNNTEVKQEKPVSALSLIELLHSNKKECGTQREDLSNSPKKEEIIISSPVGVKIDQSNDLLQLNLQKSKNDKSPVNVILVPAGFNLGTLNSQKKDVVSSDSNSYLVTKTKQKQSLNYPRSPQPCKTVKTVPKVTQKSVSPVSNAVHGSETSTPATTESDTATTKPPSTLLQRLLKLKELQIEGNIV